MSIATFEEHYRLVRHAACFILRSMHGKNCDGAVQTYVCSHILHMTMTELLIVVSLKHNTLYLLVNV